MGNTSGLTAPHSVSPITDFRTDLTHGISRRIFGDRIIAFADTVPDGARVIEIGAGVYDHTPFFPGMVTFDADPDQQPDILGDAHDMPIEDGSFDVVLACSVLEHVHDPYQVGREISRILAPGGRVFCWVPFTFGVHAFPDDISRFTEEGLRILFERAGLEIESSTVEPYNGVVQNLSNTVHAILPRTHRRGTVRNANRVLNAGLRAALPLDRRLRLKTMYAGPEVIARKPAA